MLASILAMLIAICFTFGIFAYYVQYTLPENFAILWFVAMLILAFWQITDFLTPYITKILP